MTGCYVRFFSAQIILNKFSQVHTSPMVMSANFCCFFLFSISVNGWSGFSFLIVVVDFDFLINIFYFYFRAAWGPVLPELSAVLMRNISSSTREALNLTVGKHFIITKQEWNPSLWQCAWFCMNTIFTTFHPDRKPRLSTARLMEVLGHYCYFLSNSRLPLC